jgi:hypothetical protein
VRSRAAKYTQNHFSHKKKMSFWAHLVNVFKLLLDIAKAAAGHLLH